MDLYQDEILDHYKFPRNKRRLVDPTYSFEAVNPLCGDKLGLDLKLKGNTIAEVGFWGEGCAISQSAMSMVSEELIGKDIQDIPKIDKDYILTLLGVPVGPSRLKCALLSKVVLDGIFSAHMV
jgi:nitrogen fixation protein NifU and related proteins